MNEPAQHSIATSPMGRFAAALAVFLAALVTFYPATRNPFVWDTLNYLGPHQHWLTGLDFDRLRWMFTAFVEHNWHPLTWLSWAIDYQLYGGFSTWGFHFTNNVVHALNSVLVLFLALRIFRLGRGERAHGDPHGALLLGALAAALLFAVHPQHVESVAWVAERKDVLCQFFMLAALLAYLRYGGAHGETRWYVASLALFALALASKPMAVTLPAILLLLDVFPLRRWSPLLPRRGARETPPLRLLAEKLPFFLLSAVSIALTLAAQQAAIKSIGLDLRILNAFNSVLFYLGKWLAPFDLGPFYPYFIHPGEPLRWWAWLPVVGVITITGLALLAWRRGRPVWLIAWLAYLVSLSPVLGLIQVGVQGAADRYTYFPTLPACLLAGWALVWLLQRAVPWVRVTSALSALVLVLCLSWLTREQIHVWSNPVSLWSRAVEIAPRHLLPKLRLGVAHLGAGEFTQAQHLFSELSQRHPDLADARAFLALSRQELGRHREAIALWAELAPERGRIIDSRIDANCAWYNRGWSEWRLGLREEALASFAAVDPNSAAGRAAALWIVAISEEPAGTTDPARLPGLCTQPLTR